MPGVLLLALALLPLLLSIAYNLNAIRAEKAHDARHNKAEMQSKPIGSGRWRFVASDASPIYYEKLLNNHTTMKIYYNAISHTWMRFELYWSNAGRCWGRRAAEMHSLDASRGCMNWDRVE